MLYFLFIRELTNEDYKPFNFKYNYISNTRNYLHELVLYASIITTKKALTSKRLSIYQKYKLNYSLELATLPLLAELVANFAGWAGYRKRLISFKWPKLPLGTLLSTISALWSIGFRNR